MRPVLILFNDSWPVNSWTWEALKLFSRMLDEVLTPDDVAFTVVHNACSCAGLVEEVCLYFDSMKNNYYIIPSPDHYTCMVDFLGRSGKLKATYEPIKSMHVEAHAAAWGAFLGACRLHGDIELGEVVASWPFELEPHPTGCYVLLLHIYAAADRWLDVSNVKNMM